MPEQKEMIDAVIKEYTAFTAGLEAELKTAKNLITSYFNIKALCTEIREVLIKISSSLSKQDKEGLKTVWAQFNKLYDSLLMRFEDLLIDFERFKKEEEKEEKLMKIIALEIERFKKLMVQLPEISAIQGKDI